VRSTPSPYAGHSCQSCAASVSQGWTSPAACLLFRAQAAQAQQQQQQQQHLLDTLEVAAGELLDIPQVRPLRPALVMDVARALVADAVVNIPAEVDAPRSGISVQITQVREARIVNIRDPQRAVKRWCAGGFHGVAVTLLPPVVDAGMLVTKFQQRHGGAMLLLTAAHGWCHCAPREQPSHLRAYERIVDVALEKVPASTTMQVTTVATQESSASRRLTGRGDIHEA
jgi:hypothetical protein